MKQKEFCSLDTALGYVNHELAIAEMHDSFGIDEIGQQREADDINLIYNASDETYADAVSDDYKLTQHRDFFLPALNAIGEVIDKPQQTRVEVKDARERVDIEVLPENGRSKVEADKGDVVNIGFRLSNSFDRSIRESIFPYAERLVCTNGMVLKKSLGGVRRVHRGDYSTDNLIESTEDVFETAINTLPEVVGDALDREIEDEDQAEVEIEAAGFGTSYTDQIVDRFEVNSRETSRKSPTAWDLYNSTTYVIEHLHEDIAESTRETHHRRAEKILTGVTEPEEIDV